MKYITVCDKLTDSFPRPCYTVPIKFRRSNCGKKDQKKAFVSTGDCVACGCCLKVCPRNAIEIWKGIMAKIDMNACIGCGKCAKECPASVIVIQEADA